MSLSWKPILRALLITLLALGSIGVIIPEVFAWGLSVTPDSRDVPAGGSTTFTVSVTGTIAGNPNVHLYGTPVGWHPSFSVNDRPAPFVSTLTVDIIPSYGPGTSIMITVHADPAGPEPERTDSVHIRVISATAWDLGVTPSSRDVGPGGSTTFTVYVTGAITGNPNVHLYGSAPIAVTFSFSTNDRPAPFTSTMTITVNPAAPTGSRIITIYADPAGAEAPKNRQVTLNVITLTMVMPWSVSVSPISKSVLQGASTSFTVSVTGSIPGNPNVHLMIGSPVIVGMTFSFSTNDRPAPFTSTMTVSVTSSVGPSDYSRTVIAHPVSGATDKTSSFHVVVQAPSPTTWDLLVTPTSGAIAPGHTASFTVSVTGSIAGNPNVQLLVSPPVLGITASFSTNNVPAPFTSTMTVSVDPSKAPGDYVLPVWANPASVLWPGPGNKAVNVHILVGAATTTTTGLPPFDFSMSASPTEQTIAPGGGTTYAVVVSLVSGSSQNVALSVSGAPSDVSTSLNPMSGSPSFNSILSVSTTSSVAPGQYTITVTGIAGAISHTATVTLTVTQPTDFRIDMNPPSQTSTQGGTTSFSVNVVSLNGFNSAVGLTVEGLPAGVGGTFTVPSSIPDYSSTLTLTISSDSPTGSFALIITGSGGGVARIAKVVLVINPAQVEAEAETQTQTLVQTQTTKQSGTAPAYGVMEMMQENSLLIVAALIILVIILAAIAMSRRSRPSAPQQQMAGRVFCGKCGTENPPSNEFCSSCGNKLKSN